MRYTWKDTWDDFELFMGLMGFAREVAFRGLSGKRKFRFDFAHEGAKVALEYDGMGRAGDTQERGGHETRSGILADAEKGNEAALCGWTLVRCHASTIEDGRCQSWVEKALEVAEIPVVSE